MPDHNDFYAFMSARDKTTGCGCMTACILLALAGFALMCLVG